MKTMLIDKNIKYTGLELSPHYIFKNFNVCGDAIVAFIGEADVDLDHMVDLEDVLRKDKIYSPKMLNFLGEFFSISLLETILFQRMIIVLIKEYIEKTSSAKLSRIGDDLYFSGDSKLTVSIATKSVTSTLIHVGVNIETKGTPIKTSGLNDFNINPEQIAKVILENFKNEVDSIMLAKCKVRQV